MRSGILGISFVVMMAVAVVGCIPPTPAPPPATLYKDLALYNNPANPFLQAISGSPTLDPNSANYVTHLAQITNRQTWWNADWSVPIFYADSAHAKRDINITIDWRTANVFHNQRIPDCTTGTVGGDGHATVVNQVEGCVEHYWGFNKHTGFAFPNAFWPSAQPKDFDGTWRAQGGLPSRIGPTASNLVGGGVWPDELTSGIPRGQIFIVAKNHNRAGVHVDPANHHDGTGTCQWDMAPGFHIQMNPSYDMAGLYSYEKVYGQALKTYGAYLSDSNNPDSGITAFSAMPAKVSCINNPFVGCFPDIPSNETNGDILLHYNMYQFRVIAHSGFVSTSNSQSRYSTYCGTYDNDTVSVAAPTLSSVSPSTAAAGSTVTLTGTNLTGCYRVQFGTADAWNPTVVSATQVCGVVPAGSGTVAVKARTGGGTSGTVNFTYGSGGPLPTLSGISPSSGTTAGGTVCTLTGTNLTGTTGVSFGGTAGTSIVNVSSTSVRATSPAKSAGTYGVTATTASGTSNGVNYTYNAPPTLSAIAPSSGTTAGGTACTLTGTNLTGCTAVSFGGTAASGIVVDSATQTRCTSPAGSAGTVSVAATTANGTSNGVNYTYTTGGPGYTTTLNPIDDTYALWDNGGGGGSGATHDGTNLVFQANSVYDNWPFLKFDLTGIQGSTVTSATLRLYWWSAAANYTAKVFSCATDTWTEETLTWNNKPAIGTQQASFLINSTVGWYNVNLTSYVNTEFGGNKLVTFIIRDDAYQNKMSQAYSKETGGASNKPQLVVISQ